MKFPLSWLSEFIDTGLTPEQISDTLTSAGLEVDAMERVKASFSGVVIGEILKAEKHPDADKLTIAQLSDGNETVQVVCAAPNCRAGIKVAFAKIGAVLPDGDKTFTVKKAKLRNVESSGMLCSEKELLIGEESDKIIEYTGSLPVGSDLASNYDEIIYEIGLTPNLGHCANIIGIARELSAATGKPLKHPKISVKKESEPDLTNEVKVTVLDTNKCPRYACRLIKDVEIKPSPEWLQNRLNACGIRPINNVVDITNYVLLERGHPLHAFDYNLIKGKQIVVRCAETHSKFTTLDNKERELTNEDLLIWDLEHPVAIAGVMGGLNSEVSDNTKDVLLEAAYFLPSSIRKTSKRLGLMSEASKRFERGTDPNCLNEVLDRAAMLIEEIAGGKVVKGIIDIKEKSFPEKVVSCRLKRINQLLGTQLSLSEVEEIFKRLEFKPHWNGRDAFEVTIPSYRNDVATEIDLVEEVARIYGYNNISTKETRFTSSTIPHAPTFLFDREVRARLISEGLQEFLTCDLIGPSILETIKEPLMSKESTVVIKNPTSVEQSILRTSLLPGMLQLVKHNIDHQTKDIGGFEVGRIHYKDGDQYKEQTVAAIVLSGKNIPHHWKDKPTDVDFYQLKGIIESALKELRIPSLTFLESDSSIFHTGRQASIYVGSLEIGSLGEIHPAILRRLDVQQRILYAEFNLHDLMRVRKGEIKIQPLQIYPASERDWTVTLPKTISIQTVMKTINQKSTGLLETVSLLDVYESEKIGRDNRNITFRMVYRDANKTIEQESVEKEHWRIVQEVEKEIVKK